MCDEEERPLPNWLFFLQAFCFLTYRMFDEMDGKQARRTGNSSALGMLFDHGCDAMTVGLNCIIMAKLLSAGDDLWSILPLVFVISVFFFAMLEEYFKGIMVLPVGNGVSDGSIVLFWGYFTCGIFGNKWAIKTLITVLGVDLNFSRIITILLVVF